MYSVHQNYPLQVSPTSKHFHTRLCMEN